MDAAATGAGTRPSQRRSPQAIELERRGIVRLTGLDPEVAGSVADRVWSILGRRGLDRGDPTTWPSGIQSKLQALRQAEVFAPFLTPEVDAFADEVLGPSAWAHMDAPQALVTFPEPGPWVVPHGSWHFDFPARGSISPPDALRLLAFVEPVDPRGGGTLVVEGSHALTIALMNRSDRGDAGSSADVRRKLRRHPWFDALFSRDGNGDDAGGGGDRNGRRRFFEPVEIDGVEVKVTELTGGAGEIFAMHPWTLHARSTNTGQRVRSMCSHSILRHGNVFYG